ncbi:MAG: PIN domain-containing protein [Nitrososphaerales archaeon]
MLFETRYFWAIFRSKDRRTVRELRAIYDRADTAYVSSISIYEVYKQTIGSEDVQVADVRVTTIENEFDVVVVDAEIAAEGARISHRSRIPMADSLIMATAKRLRVPCVTDDPHFTEVKRNWIRARPDNEE